MIVLFHGTYEYLSNFFDFCPVHYDGLTYRNSESAYQAAKSVSLVEKVHFVNVSPRKAKRMGKSVLMRSDWDSVKGGIMADIVHAKFSQHPELAALLIATGDEYLEEGNYWHDNYFGDCKCPKCEGIQGENVLGYALMGERRRLQDEAIQTN
ncbi:MAG: NADAR family protein [Lachnospiraceae bacterium]|nr:NADAR family protein [Lachnospiraceae bacterium]